MGGSLHATVPDTTHSTLFVDTLYSYLERDGNYDLTAKTLSLHRSTLRYRLQRIRDLSGHNPTDPDTRFNLQLASRACKAVQAMRQQPDRRQGRRTEPCLS
jgi:DNA-binding PucR family transcriptional regulator